MILRRMAISSAHTLTRQTPLTTVQRMSKMKNVLSSTSFAIVAYIIIGVGSTPCIESFHRTIDGVAASSATQYCAFHSSLIWSYLFVPTRYGYWQILAIYWPTKYLLLLPFLFGIGMFIFIFTSFFVGNTIRK